jgi:hypothetical protein
VLFDRLRALSKRSASKGLVVVLGKGEKISCVASETML